MWVFFDANMLFLAAKSDGVIRGLVSRLLAAEHECWVDAYVVDEARRNISAKAPNSGPKLDHIVSQLRLSASTPAQTRGHALHAVAEKDRPVVAAATALGCESLVTGDRTHFEKFFGQSITGVDGFERGESRSKPFQAPLRPIACGRCDRVLVCPLVPTPVLAHGKA
ncbi:MAG: hypothetical protein WD060_14800 [Pirellulales bacterium]